MAEFHITVEAAGVEVSFTIEDGYNPDIVDDLINRIPATLTRTYRSLVETQRELGVVPSEDDEDAED